MSTDWASALASIEIVTQTCMRCGREHQARFRGVCAECSRELNANAARAAQQRNADTDDAPAPAPETPRPLEGQERAVR